MASIVGKGVWAAFTSRTSSPVQRSRVELSRIARAIGSATSQRERFTLFGQALTSSRYGNSVFAEASSGRAMAASDRRRLEMIASAAIVDTGVCGRRPSSLRAAWSIPAQMASAMPASSPSPRLQREIPRTDAANCQLHGGPLTQAMWMRNLPTMVQRQRRP